MTIAVIGLDTAKTVFQVHGVWTCPRRVEGWDQNITRPRAS